MDADICRVVAGSPAFTAVVTENLPLYNAISKERAQNHIVFCSMLAVATNIVLSLSGADRALVNSFNLLEALEPRMQGLFSAHRAKDFALTLAFTEECRMITSFVSCLAQFSLRVKRSKNRCIDEFSRSSLVFLRWIVDVLVHRSRVTDFICPVSREERAQSEQSTQSKSASQFVLSLKTSLHYTVRNILICVYYFSESHRVFYSTDYDFMGDSLLFLPYLEMPMKTNCVSLGTLNVLLMYCKDEFAEAGVNRALLGELVEICLALFASQTALSLKNPNMDLRQREQIAVDSSAELLAACDSFKTYLAGDNSKKLLDRLARFTESVAGTAT